MLTKEIKEELVGDLLDLVAIDTSNPPGGELPAAELVKSRMAGLGGLCSLQEFAPGRANAVCRFTFSRAEEGPCLIFNAHLDVVPAGDGSWTSPPFQPRTIDGRVYGRGSSDDKASCAAIMAALRLVLKSAPNLKGELVFTAVGAEETGGLGTQYWVSHRGPDNRPSMAVVCESTNLQPFIGHKGVSRRKVTVRGRSVHSSVPQAGRNAIYPVARLALFIEDLNRRLAAKSDPALGSPVVSANVIRGGVKDNVIPDYCELQMDRRRIPGEGPDQFDRELEEWAREMTAADPSFQYQVEILGSDKEPVMISPGERIVQELLGALA